MASPGHEQARVPAYGWPTGLPTTLLQLYGACGCHRLWQTVGLYAGGLALRRRSASLRFSCHAEVRRGLTRRPGE
jgi:hypothetical protein